MIAEVKTSSVVQSQETSLSPLTAPSSDPQLSPTPSLQCFLLPTGHATLPPLPPTAPIPGFFLFGTSQRTEVEPAERRGEVGLSSEVVQKAKHVLLGETFPRSWYVPIPPPGSPPVRVTAHPPWVSVPNPPSGQL